MCWTEITREQYRRDELRYASDTADEEWAVLFPFMPARKRLGRPREIVNALFYIGATGCQWRALPIHFPVRSTVQGYFYTWRDDGTWDWINGVLIKRARDGPDC